MAWGNNSEVIFMLNRLWYCVGFYILSFVFIVVWSSPQAQVLLPIERWHHTATHNAGIGGEERYAEDTNHVTLNRFAYR